MALTRGRKRSGDRVDYWPGFVDALSTLLLAIMFLLSVFVLAQFILSQEITGKDTVLNRLNSQLNELTALLSLERSANQDLEDQIKTLSANQDLEDQIKTLSASSAEQRAEELSDTLDDQRKVTRRAMNQVNLLNQQISALRKQIAALEDALEASEIKDRESSTKIADLGKRLNVALAKRVQELNRYRSDFFGRLREILGNRDDIRVVGDRFVFQSEVLFPSGGATLNEAGLDEMTKLAKALIELGREIPDEIEWVLRVDGHTDNIPLSGTGRYRDNWELSSGRATSVVKYLIEQGVPAKRLVAAGFGEFQPLDPEDSQEARDRNRRIELKLTEK